MAAGWNRGIKHTAETRRKITEGMRLWWAQHPDIREQRRKANLGRKHTEETKQKMRLALKQLKQLKQKQKQ